MMHDAVVCAHDAQHSCMRIRQRTIIFRGHVQRDEQHLDQVSHRPRTSSHVISRGVVGVWAGFLRRRQLKCVIAVCGWSELGVTRIYLC